MILVRYDEVIIILVIFFGPFVVDLGRKTSLRFGEIVVHGEEVLEVVAVRLIVVALGVVQDVDPMRLFSRSSGPLR